MHNIPLLDISKIKLLPSLIKTKLLYYNENKKDIGILKINKISHQLNY